MSRIKKIKKFMNISSIIGLVVFVIGLLLCAYSNKTAGGIIAFIGISVALISLEVIDKLPNQKK